MAAPGRRVAAGLLVLAGLGLLTAPAGAATDAPDLDAFSGCVSAHSTLTQLRQGYALRPAQRNLLVATIAASRTRGARKVVKQLRRATGTDVEAAMVALTTWCTAHGVPPITVVTTAPPG